jgi:hypothetical protein
VDYITWSYKIVNRMRGLGLVTQNVLDLHQFGPKLVNTDMPGREFDAAWRGIGRYARLVLWVLVPFYVMWFFLFGTKAFLARSLEMDGRSTARGRSNGFTARWMGRPYRGFGFTTCGTRPPPTSFVAACTLRWCRSSSGIARSP